MWNGGINVLMLIVSIPRSSMVTRSCGRWRAARLTYFIQHDAQPFQISFFLPSRNNSANFFRLIKHNIFVLSFIFIHVTMKENYGTFNLYPNEQVALAVGDYACNHSTKLPEHITDHHVWGVENQERANYMISPFQAQFQVWFAKALGAKRSEFPCWFDVPRHPGSMWFFIDFVVLKYSMSEVYLHELEPSTTSGYALSMLCLPRMLSEDIINAHDEVILEAMSFSVPCLFLCHCYIQYMTIHWFKSTSSRNRDLHRLLNSWLGRSCWFIWSRDNTRILSPVRKDRGGDFCEEWNQECWNYCWRRERIVSLPKFYFLLIGFVCIVVLSWQGLLSTDLP